jgi:NADH-quinone oxidoreductase subunit F
MDQFIDGITTRQAHEKCACRAFGALEHAGKTIVCAALDGDTEARAARFLLGRDPAAVPEGLARTARAVGAQRAILAVPVDLGALLTPVERSCGDIEAAYNIKIELREAPNTLVLAEPSALLRFLEGRQAIPYLPAKDGGFYSLDGAPALVITAETAAKAAARPGMDNADTGPGDTVIVTLTGDVRRAATMEVPAGTTLGALIRDAGGGVMDAGGGVMDGSAIRAVQLGGPASIYIGAGELDEIMVGSLVGEDRAFGLALIHVIAGGRCMVEAAREATEYLNSQSCGKCVFCREGTRHLASLLGDIASGEGRREDLELMEELGRQMRTGCVCALGRTAAGPALSSLRLFPEEYEQHIRRKSCPAGAGGGGAHG